MKILVTGSNGLVGTAVREESVNFTEHEFIFVASKDCDLTKYDTLALFKHHAPDCVLHLAANVGGLYKNMNYKVDMLEKNLLMNFNVVRCCFSSDIRRAVCVLSTCIFPDKTQYPINETMLHDGSPHTSNDAYAYAKRMMDIHCQSYNEQYNTNYSCVIPTNIYGKNDNYSLEDSHVIPGLIHKCYLAKQHGVDFEVRGTGKPLRQFIYANDLASIMIRLVGKMNRENTIISDSAEHSIGEIALLIAKCFDYEHRMVYNSSYSDGQYKKTADNTKLLSIFPDLKFIDIQDGMNITVKHFIDNYNSIRK